MTRNPRPLTGATMAFGDGDYGPSYRVADTRPNLIDALEESWAMPPARATRLSARARLRGLVHAASVAIAENCIPAACGLLAGMLGTVGLAYVVEANAALIAAAPELYEALENCANILFSLCPRIPHDGPRDADELREYEMFGGASSHAFRALAKARGEQP